MKKLFATVALAAAMLFGADVKGSWAGQVNRPDGSKDNVHLELKQDGNTVSGSVGEHQGELLPISNAKLEDNQLKFEVQANQSKFTIALVLEGETLKGTVTRTRDGQSTEPLPIELKRSRANQ